MKRILAPILLLTLLVGTPASSTDFQKGEIKTALSEWTPLAEQGNVVAQFNLGVMYR